MEEIGRQTSKLLSTTNGKVNQEETGGEKEKQRKEEEIVYIKGNSG